MESTTTSTQPVVHPQDAIQLAVNLLMQDTPSSTDVRQAYALVVLAKELRLGKWGRTASRGCYGTVRLPSPTTPAEVAMIPDVDPSVYTSDGAPYEASLADQDSPTDFYGH